MTYTVIVLVSFAGLLVGAILSRLSPEEMPAARRYFPWMQSIVLLAALLFFVHSLGFPSLLAIPALLLTALYAVSLKNTLSAYFALALALAFGSSNPSVLLFLATLTFIYGLPTGSLFAMQNAPLLHLLPRLLLRHGIFVVAALVLPFIFRIL